MRTQHMGGCPMTGMRAQQVAPNVYGLRVVTLWFPLVGTTPSHSVGGAAQTYSKLQRPSSTEALGGCCSMWQRPPAGDVGSLACPPTVHRSWRTLAQPGAGGPQ
jgi:hypothetical protein